MFGINRKKEKNDELVRTFAFEYGIDYSSAEDFWKKLSEMIDSLKEEKNNLENRVYQSEWDLKSLQSQIQEKEGDLQNVRNDKVNLQNLLKNKEDKNNEHIAKEDRLAQEMMDMIRLVDDGRIEENIQKETVLDLLSQRLEDTLEILDITSVNKTSGDVDSNYQKVEGVKPTDKPELDGKICESLSRGFIKGQKLIKEQKVVIYTVK